MNSRNLLIIEDEISIAKQIKGGLGKAYDITIAPNAELARPLLASGSFAVVILDLVLPPLPDTPFESFRLLEEIGSLDPQIKVIAITENSEQENAMRAIRLGAADCCSKPVDLKLLKFILERSFRIHELEHANRQMRHQDNGSILFCGMLGASEGMIKLFENIRQVSGTDYPVLITGATGTGKGMAAQAVHCLSKRSANPLVSINCASIPEYLMESELFGYEKGAFTGAAGRKFGQFEKADKGTLFLDEIADLPLSMQVKMLRFLQEGTIERLGGERTIKLDVRIVAATNMNIEDAIGKGLFRRDLYFRLNVIRLRMPDLKKRPDDILILAHNILHEEAQAIGRGQVVFLPAAMDAMTAYQWPGNVRELRNRICRALVTTNRRTISAADLGFNAMEKEGADRLMTLKEARNLAEIRVIRQALILSGNNVSKAAQFLHISRPTLHDLLNKHGIEAKV
jgi:two-component system, NtrC family, response regulator